MMPELTPTLASAQYVPGPKCYTAAGFVGCVPDPDCPVHGGEHMKALAWMLTRWFTWVAFGSSDTAHDLMRDTATVMNWKAEDATKPALARPRGE